MKEVQVRREIYRMLRRLYYWPITQTDTSVCSTCGALVKPKTGRPDILALSPYGPSIVVEVKTLNLLQQKSFPFSAITPEQRKWLTRWKKDGGPGFIAIGTVGVPRGQRKLWLIPWAHWQIREATIVTHGSQQSIPYFAGPGFSKRLQNEEWDLARWCTEYELQWESGCWHIPEGKPWGWQRNAPPGEREL